MSAPFTLVFTRSGEDVLHAVEFKTHKDIMQYLRNSETEFGLEPKWFSMRQAILLKEGKYIAITVREKWATTLPRKFVSIVYVPSEGIGFSYSTSDGWGELVVSDKKGKKV